MICRRRRRFGRPLSVAAAEAATGKSGRTRRAVSAARLRRPSSTVATTPLRATAAASGVRRAADRTWLADIGTHPWRLAAADPSPPASTSAAEAAGTNACRRHSRRTGSAETCARATATADRHPAAERVARTRGVHPTADGRMDARFGRDRCVTRTRSGGTRPYDNYDRRCMARETRVS